MEANRHTVAKIKGRAMNSRYPYLDFKVKDLLRRWDTEDEAVIKRAITQSMYGTSKTIVLVGQYTHKSTWVKHEVESTLEKRKPVYAIWLKDESGPVPKCLTANNIRAYSWSEERLQDLATR
jgi:hypothetical protein